MPPAKLNDVQKMDLLVRYIGGERPVKLAESFQISPRTVFNTLARNGIHRCRCADVHFARRENSVWAIAAKTGQDESSPRLGTGGVITGLSSKRISITWEGWGPDVFDVDQAGKFFTFKRELELFT